jgi:transcriptional regulator
MYIPKHYIENDKEKLVSFMEANSFAVMVNVVNGLPWGTHLPFVVKEEEGRVMLYTHMARANDQWKAFGNSSEVLIIFQGPHAYISPSLYEKQQNVPTWNYIAAHAYGKPVIISDNKKVIMLLEEMIRTYEKAYLDQWKSLAPEYVSKMVKGIVAFGIEVTRLEGKYKLSQNKTVNEQHKIIDTLQQSDDPAARGVAAHMQERLGK